MRCDVVIFGGGIAGLWSLHRILELGYSAMLFEAHALGAGQSVQAQGIIHGGGKYALRRVGDLAAVRAIRDMPERWRRHLSGEQDPDLRAARLLSPVCYLWIPRGGLGRRLAASTFFPLVRQAGLMASAPRTLPKADWPAALRDSALRVERMAEPVLDTQSTLSALAASLSERLFSYDATTLVVRSSAPHFELELAAGGQPARQIQSRAVVLCAGTGNEGLLGRFGAAVPMQRRPLRMLMLRGQLPELFAHCVDGGRTRLTVTSARDAHGRTVWQLGGEIAERHAERSEGELVAAARSELQSTLPGLPLSQLEAASYVAVRAEAADPRGMRPSGVHVQEAAQGLFAAWPTKWALAPLLAEELGERLQACLLSPAAETQLDLRADFPLPKVAQLPWEEEREWRPLDATRR